MKKSKKTLQKFLTPKDKTLATNGIIDFAVANGWQIEVRLVNENRPDSFSSAYAKSHILSGNSAQWEWDAVKEDVQRTINEQQKLKQREELKEQALAKLSVAERVALGFEK